MEKTKDKKQFFYGWLIVLGCMLIQAVPFTVAANLSPAFTNYVTSAEGFSLAQFSLIFTIGTFVSAVCAPFIGKFFSSPKANIKMIYIVGSCALGGAFAGYSLANGRIWVYYLLSIFVQVACIAISSIGVPTLINAWFTEKKGLATGLAFSGSGIGNMCLQLLTGKWLSTIGYKATYVRLGLLAAVVGLIVAIFIVRLPKSDEELAANKSKKSDEESDSNEDNSSNTSNWGYAFSEVTKLKYFWIFAASFLFVGLYVGGLALQFIPYLQKLNNEGSLLIPAATIASTFGLCSMVGNLCGGILFDKLGTVKSLAFSGVLVVLCGVSLIFVPHMNILGFVFAVFMGVSLFTYIIGPSYLSAALFGNKEFGTILGIVQIFFAVGFAIGSTLFGFITDMAGYNAGWISTIVYAVIAYAGLLTSVSKIEKLNKENNVKETKRIA